MGTETHDTEKDSTVQEALEVEGESGPDAMPGDTGPGDALPSDTLPGGGAGGHPAAAEATDGTDATHATDGAPTPEADTPAEAEAPATKKPSRREALEAEGDVAADFLEGLLDIADIVGDIDVDIDGDRAAVSIVDSEDGRVPRRLVGPDGKVLDALQELTRLAVQTETGERSRLMLDVAGHRSGRRMEIVEITQGVIAEVRETGEQVEMDPMTAFERKIVHDEVLAAGLRSESEGVEPRRYVVVLPGT